MGKISKNELNTSLATKIEEIDLKANISDLETTNTQLAQIEAEINTPDSASLSLTELQQIKSVTDSYASPAKLTLGGATLFNAITGGQAVAVGGTKTFMAKNGIKYFDSCNKVFINGTGVNVTITNNTTAAKDIMAIPMTGTPYENYTADQMNALVNTYFEGLKSTNKMEILTRGKNLFDGKLESGSYSTTTGAKVPSSNARSVNKTKAAKGTYRISNLPSVGDKWVFKYDKNNIFLGYSYIAASASSVGTITVEVDGYITFHIVATNPPLTNSIQIEFGSTATNYQPYVESKAKIQCTNETKFTLAKLPNNVKNEILINDGKWRAIKMVERYVLQGADITALNVGANLDTVVLAKKTDSKSNGSITDAKNRIIPNFLDSATIPTDTATNVGLQYDSSNTAFALTVDKGTYASLAASQTALAGTVIYYELAKPITIEEEDLYQYGIQVEGLPATHNAYTEFIANDYDMLGDVGIEYSINLAKAIEELKDGVTYLKEDTIDNRRILIPRDYTAGSNYVIKGDLNAGFAGFIQPSEMGKIGASNLDFNGTNLALEIGLSGGTAINSNTAWIKYVYKNKVCFRPIKSIRHSATWNQLYNAGIVYPTQDEGLLPPNGRMGRQLSISAADNSINTTTLTADAAQGFLRTDAIVANVGDVVTLKGWTNPANNGDFTVVSITANKIVLSGGTLVNESNNKLGRIFKKSLAVTQGKVIKVGGLDFRVRLMRGASNDPLDSYDHADRDSIGVDNEWNAIILPLHSEAKLQNWAYPAYAGTTQYWGTNLTDADFITHYTLGSGSYAWCQETRDGELSYQRVLRGYVGASALSAHYSWNVLSSGGFQPVLELI